jgi:hypothetical protein
LSIETHEKEPTMPPFITVNSSGPDIPDGVYPVILTDIVGPKTVTAQRGPNAGQDIDLFDWVFAIEAGQYENTVISVSSSTASGPRSKMYAFLTALFGGKAPPVGTAFEKADLVGRSALATVQKDDQGWLRITNLGALPAGYSGTSPAANAHPLGSDAPPAFPAAREQVTAEAAKVPF